MRLLCGAIRAHDRLRSAAHPPLPTAGLLGAVHRLVRLRDQLLTRGRRTRQRGRDADARADRQVLVVDPERFARRVDDAVGEARRVLLRRHLADDAELVAAEASQRVERTQRRAEASRNGDEQPVAAEMAVAVVDLLEAVEVDEQQRSDVVACGPRQRRVDEPGEGVPVRQPGQRIVRRQVEEAQLVRLVRRDLRERHDARPRVHRLRVPDACVHPHLLDLLRVERARPHETPVPGDVGPTEGQARDGLGVRAVVGVDGCEPTRPSRLRQGQTGERPPAVVDTHEFAVKEDEDADR